MRARATDSPLTGGRANVTVLSAPAAVGDGDALVPPIETHIPRALRTTIRATVLGLGALLVAAAPAAAWQSPRWSLEQLTAWSDLIVRRRVSATRCAWTIST